MEGNKMNDGKEKALPSCCAVEKVNDKKPSGLAEGVIYGLIPHAGCIAFIAFAILGATTMSAIFQPLLMDRNFFYGLILLSVGFATISAAFYLNKRGLLSANGIVQAKGYLSMLYGTTAVVNLLFFFVIFPMLTNAIPIGQASSFLLANSTVCQLNSTGETCPLDQLSKPSSTIISQPPLQLTSAKMSIEVDIPCPGHAPLIKQELSKLPGITGITFGGFNTFEITYDPSKLAKSDILDIGIFKTYPAREI